MPCTRAAARGPQASATGPSTHSCRLGTGILMEPHCANVLRSARADSVPSASTSEISSMASGGKCFCRTRAATFPTTRPLLQTNRSQPTTANNGTDPSTELKHSNVSAIGCPSPGVKACEGGSVARSAILVPYSVINSFAGTAHGSIPAFSISLMTARMVATCWTSTYFFETRPTGIGLALPRARRTMTSLNRLRPNR